MANARQTPVSERPGPDEEEPEASEAFALLIARFERAWGQLLEQLRDRPESFTLQQLVGMVGMEAGLKRIIDEYPSIKNEH